MLDPVARQRPDLARRRSTDLPAAAGPVHCSSSRIDDRLELEAALAAYPDAKVSAATEFVDDPLGLIDKLLNLVYVLLALSVVVSLFGMVNTLILSVFERTRELGMLRAVGMTRRQTRRMVRHESVITALIGAALGLPLGPRPRRGRDPPALERRRPLRAPGHDARRLRRCRRRWPESAPPCCRPTGLAAQRPEGAPVRVDEQIVGNHEKEES